MSKVLLMFLMLGISNIFSQNLCSSFPSISEADFFASSSCDGQINISNKETTGFYGTEINLKNGILSIGNEGDYKEEYTFKTSSPVFYNNNESVYYVGENKAGSEFNIYFQLKTQGGKYSAIHLVNVIGKYTMTYYIKKEK